MARTIRRERTVNPNVYTPTKRARKIEKRRDRQSVRNSLREYRAC